VWDLRLLNDYVVNNNSSLDLFLWNDYVVNNVLELRYDVSFIS
jgi:hypothetical protein